VACQPFADDLEFGRDEIRAIHEMRNTCPWHGTDALKCAVYLSTAKMPFDGSLYRLTDYGDVSTPDAAQVTLGSLARQVIANSGGVIVVDNDVVAEFTPANIYQLDPGALTAHIDRKESEHAEPKSICPPSRELVSAVYGS